MNIAEWIIEFVHKNSNQCIQSCNNFVWPHTPAVGDYVSLKNNVKYIVVERTFNWNDKVIYILVA